MLTQLSEKSIGSTTETRREFLSQSSNRKIPSEEYQTHNTENS